MTGAADVTIEGDVEPARHRVEHTAHVAGWPQPRERSVIHRPR
ncbi:hypothetical protein [Amycolatopsis sp. NPDC051061]